MLVFKKGYVSPLISMVEIIKKEHDENNKYTQKVIEDRKKRGVPLADAGSDNLKLSTWEEDYYSQFSDVKISCRSVSANDLMQVKSSITKAFELDAGESNKEKNKAVITFLKLSLVKVDGLKDAETGQKIIMDEENLIDFCLLEDADLLFNIYSAVRIWQELSASKKKELE